MADSILSMAGAILAVCSGLAVLVVAGVFAWRALRPSTGDSEWRSSAAASAKARAGWKR